MKQTKSFDLLSELDRRSANISVIYVAPHADRQNALQAILTQEKLGREQIVLVLHDQNSAFQHPADFDVLKEMQDDLHAMLIIVASPNSGPTQRAQQRGFPVYASLETYVASLRREASPTPPTPKTTKLPVPSSVNLGNLKGVLNATPKDGQILPNAHASGLSRAGDAVNLAVDGLSGTDSSMLFSGEYENAEEPKHPGFPPLIERNTPNPSLLSSKMTDGLPPLSSIYSSETIRNTSALSGTQDQRIEPHRKPHYRWLIASALTILALLLVIGGMAYSRVGILDAARMHTPTSGHSGLVSPAPTVGQDLKHMHIITAVTSIPNPSLHQVQAHIVSSTQQSQTVDATGQKQTQAATNATGPLTFQSRMTIGFPLPLNLPIRSLHSGVLVKVTSNGYTVPPGGSTTASAQAVIPGTRGNIANRDFEQNCCAGPNQIFVSNDQPFTGGQDARSYMFVQQSDIDRAANSLRISSMQSAQNGLATKKQANEQFVGSPQCTSNVTSNHHANDRATNVTVTVSTTCTQDAHN